jgi:hypothetical protein
MPRSAELVCVPPDTVHKVWPLVRNLIYEAMRRGGLSSFGPVEETVLSGRGLLWLAWDGQIIHAAAVTTLSATEWRKVCEIVACGGKDMRRWIELIEGIEKFARAEGATATRIIGRKGWARVLRGYRAKRVVLEKELY